MIRETYKGRQLKAVKGKSYGKSRIVVNGTECGEWFGTQAELIEWAKRTINDVDSRPFEGRWAECWYEPGTYELNEIGHVTAPGGTCSCDLCKTEPWNSCQNITAGGVCVCRYCMKSYLADTTETAEAAKPEITWTDRTNYRNAPSHRQANVWDVTVNGKAYRVERAPGAYHVWDGLDWVGMYATTTDVEAAIAPDEQADNEATDGDVLAAFEAKANEISKANDWTIARTESVMLRFLRDTSPAEAATIAAALQTRNDLCA
jgi:hypothetical protein